MTFTSNLSNYPPGVTGHEPEIEGGDEFDCGPGPCVIDAHEVAATWCVTIGLGAPMRACDYHASALADGLRPVGIPVTTRPVMRPDEVLDLPAARAAVRALDANDIEPEYPEVDQSSWCACHDSPTCPDAIAEAFLPRDEYEGWAPGELAEAFGR